MTLTEGYRELMGEVRTAWDECDNFGSVQAWRFAIAEVIYFDYEAPDLVPDFNPGGASEPEDSYEVEMLRAVAAPADDMLAVLAVLDRYREMFAEEIEY